MKHPIALALVCAVASAGAVVSDRYGALYYPGEPMVFSVPTNAVSWQVVDADGVSCGSGRAAGGPLSLSDADVGGRFGAFRLEVALDQGTRESTWFARLTSKDVVPSPWIGTGTHDDHGWGRGDFRLVDLIAAAGIGIVREEPLWERTERVKGVYALTDGFEAYVDRLFAKGVRMNMLLGYGNELYENPLDVAAFSRFCAWTAEHFKGRVDRFEIWNEAANFMFHERYHKEGEAAEVWIRKFVELTHAADDAIRAVRPDAHVAVAAEDVAPTLGIMITNGIARTHNVISFHPYCHTQHRPERAFFLDDFGVQYRALAKAHGGAARWCVTEAGWTTFTGKGRFWEVAGEYPRASLSGQAECIVRMYLAAREAGCEYACQYDFMDDGLQADYAEHHFGLVRTDGTPKPSFAAVAHLSRLLGQAAFIKDHSEEPAKYRVAHFTVRGKPVLAAWCIEGECLWKVPPELPSAYVCFDLFGNERSVPREGDGHIRLTERPVYLIGK